MKRWIKYSNEKVIKKHIKTVQNLFFIKSIKYDVIKGLEDKEKGYVRKFISYNKFEEEYTKVPDDYKKKILVKIQLILFIVVLKYLSYKITNYMKK